jgi:hypothetical protein
LNYPRTLPPGAAAERPNALPSAEIDSAKEVLTIIEAALGGSRKAMLALQWSIPED